MNKHGVMAFIMGAGNLPIMATHDFIAKDGDLQHFVNGVLRATVPSEGQDDYVSQWPDAADVVSAMRIMADVVVASSEQNMDNVSSGMNSPDSAPAG